jgi:hypothetical protein
MTKPIWYIRFEPWAVADFSNYAAVHKLVDLETGEFNKTDAVHGRLKELLEVYQQFPSLQKDLETMKQYAKDTADKQTVYCASLDIDVSQQRCFNCAIQKLRPNCAVGFDIKANRLSVLASHEKHKADTASKQADSGQASQQGAQM